MPGEREFTSRKLYVYGEVPPPAEAVSVWYCPASSNELLTAIVGESAVFTVIVFAALQTTLAVVAESTLLNE